MSDNPYNDEDKPHKDPIIQDLRHARNVDEDQDPGDESFELIEPPAGEVEQEAPEPVLPEEPDPEPPTREQLETVEPPEEGPVSPEVEQLKQLFGAGIGTYLRGQLGLLLNFALIYLGRAANPATNLVSVEVEKAKLAIDAIEFIYLKTKGDMADQERSEVEGVLAELKYTFMQSAGATPPPAPPEGEA